MDFVPVDPKLKRHPKTRKIARLMAWKSLEVWPRIVSLWMWAFDFALDGDISTLQDDPLTLCEIFELSESREADAKKFFQAMIEAGFIDRHGGRFVLHNWKKGG